MARGMKISWHVWAHYKQAHPQFQDLKKVVDGLLGSSVEPRWHYESRVKSLESYALKMETARFATVSDIDDFFAATVVVENTSAIKRAKELIISKFELICERPEEAGKTHKRSWSFEFDDLRMYLKLQDNGVHYKLRDLVFEVQIKTFLQHAWSIATHDMVYKGDRVDWGLARIAYQVKAMLEHAEASIESADDMAKATCLSVTDKASHLCNDCVDLLEAFWPEDQLPHGVKRLAENVLMALKLYDKDLDFLCCKLSDKFVADGCGLSLHLSPYLTIVQVLVNTCGVEPLEKKCKDKRLKLFVTPEICFPNDVEVEKLRNVVFVSAQDKLT